MQKVSFKAQIKLPKIPKGATDPKVIAEARAKTEVHITIKGSFSTEEAGVLELLLKSWHQDKKANG